jgi:hypothetical protein
MEADGRTRLLTGDHEAKLTYTYTYDEAALEPLRNCVPPEALDGAFIPEHEQTRLVPARWNMTKGRALAKWGDQARAVIEGARRVKGRKLSVASREPQPNRAASV